MKKGLKKRNVFRLDEKGLQSDPREICKDIMEI